jgi:MFS family permease
VTETGRPDRARAARDAAGSDPRLRARPLTVALAADHLLFCLGLFSLMPVLPVLLIALQHDSGAKYVGIDLFIYTAAAGIGALGVTKWLERLPYTATVSGGLLLSGVSFGALPYVHHPAAIFAVLLLAGLGYSIHFVFSRVLIAELISGDVGRHRVNSVLQVAVNAAAAVGPLIAVWLYASGHAKALVFMVSACYVLASLTMLARLPFGVFPPPTTTRWAISRATLAMVRRDRLAWRVVITTAAGSFLYAQFYSAFAIMVARQIASHPLRALLLALPAISIVIAQTGVSWLVTRALSRGRQLFTVLALATMVFAIAMLALGAGTSVVVDAFVGVIIFSLAEMLFTPTVSTAFATLPSASRLEAFNLRQASWTLGEAVGSWCGGSVFLFFLNRGDPRSYWLIIGTVAMAGMCAVIATARGRVSPATPVADDR